MRGALRVKCCAPFPHMSSLICETQSWNTSEPGQFRAVALLNAEKAWCKHIVYVRWSVISLYHFGSESFNLFDLLCFTLDFCHGWEKGRVAAGAKILQSFDYFFLQKKKLHSTDHLCLKVDHGLAQRRMYQYRFIVVCNALGSNFCPDMKTSGFLSNYNKANCRSSLWNS